MSGVARKVEVTGAQLVSNIGSRWQKPSVLTVKPIRIHDIHVFTSCIQFMANCACNAFQWKGHKIFKLKDFSTVTKTDFPPVLGNRVAFLTELGTGHYLLGEGRASKLRKRLAKKLWPTPIKGLKEIDPPKTQIKKL